MEEGEPTCTLDQLVQRFGPWFRKHRYAGPTAFKDATQEFLKQQEGVPPSEWRLQLFRQKVGRYWGAKRRQEREARERKSREEAETRAAAAREPEFDF